WSTSILFPRGLVDAGSGYVSGTPARPALAIQPDNLVRPVLEAHHGGMPVLHVGVVGAQRRRRRGSNGCRHVDERALELLERGVALLLALDLRGLRMDELVYLRIRQPRRILRPVGGPCRAGVEGGGRRGPVGLDGEIDVAHALLLHHDVALAVAD